MRVSQHLAEMHEAGAKHHTAMAKSTRTQAELFRAMAKAADDDTETPASQLADQCDEQANLHDQFAEHHQDAKAACEKAAQDALDKVIPDQIRGVLPAPPTFTAVTRAGQPPLGDRGQKPNVPLEFEKLVTVEDEE